MLDELLGRAELKSRIEELETQRETLESQLTAETERRKTAVRERQDAAERINQLEDRIAGLEGELEHVRDDEADRSFRSVQTLPRERTRDVLARLHSYRTGAEAALTAVVTDEIPDDAAELFDDEVVLLDRASPCVLCADDAGIVRVMLSPPLLPETFVTWDDRFQLDSQWFLPKGEFTFALVRSDLFACGQYAGDERLDFEGFESDVMGRHSKGGFSQARFERRREEQIDDHREAVEKALGALSPEKLILVGDRRVIGNLDVSADVTATVDASGTPKAALTAAFDDFWKTRLYVP